MQLNTIDGVIKNGRLETQELFCLPNGPTRFCYFQLPSNIDHPDEVLEKVKEILNAQTDTKEKQQNLDRNRFDYYLTDEFTNRLDAHMKKAAMRAILSAGTSK